MEKQQHRKIKNYTDLEVYQSSYRLSITVMKEIIPRLPDAEKYDLKDQLSRASKAIPRLIAEGYAKKHQNAGFQKYLDDAMSETNETMVCLSHCKDIYQVETALCQKSLDEYDILARKLYRLSEAWDNFKKRRVGSDGRYP